ncbi:MAG: hypothetical protein OHK0029_18670 [Armatimonadaceae bacterium]
MNQKAYYMKPQTFRPLAQRRAQGEAGQSVVVAIIVLFLLLFLAGIFIAIVAGNIQNTRRATTTSAAGRFAEAGIRYLDEQLNNAPEGADWRPVPDCAFGVACAGVSQTDPDFLWLKPCTDTNNDGIQDDEPCGFTRVSLGSDVGGGPDRGPSVGGRALVRVTYAPNIGDPLSRYIRLESVGRVGQIVPEDPTTYTNSEAIGQRVELLAYKAISLNEYARNITNKDNKPVTATIGAPFPVRDRGTLRSIETVIRGPIRVNAGLNFHGINRIVLDPRYNESIEVAGPISLNGLPDATTSLTINDPTQVYIYVLNGAGAATPVVPQGLPNNAPSLFPSSSPLFTTLGPELASLVNGPAIALVRDNPRGNETVGLPQSVDPFGNTYQNLRTVGRQDPPVIDQATGANGITRYRALTRNSPPLDPAFTADNPVSDTLRARNLAGPYGWGQGMYIGNSSDVQTESETLFGGYSLRGDWLNPPENPGAAAVGKARWRGDYEYVPEGVIITLYPGYFTVEASAHDGANSRRRFYFRKPDGADAGGRLRDVRKILRYTRVNGEPVGFGTGVVNPAAKFEGYPADTWGPDRIPNTADDTPYYAGDFVIFAEGNIRIRGVVGGQDPESGAYFKRHLTVVSNATIYVDGNLLRDNISPADSSAAGRAVRGQSTIALLAKDYIAVNTTQFLTPQQELFLSETRSFEPPFPRILYNNPGNASQFAFRATFGPAQLDPANGFLLPPYLESGSGAITPGVFLRHSAASGGTADAVTNINLFVNQNNTGPNLLLFPAPYANLDPTSMSLNYGNDVVNTEGKAPAYLYNRFDLPLNSLYVPGGNTVPFGGVPPVPGQDNFMAINVDSTVTNPQTKVDYLVTRVGVAPLDIRIEALMYAQEGSFFIIPGPWFNPNPNDTFENFVSADPNRGGRRAGEVRLDQDPKSRVNPLYPFYKEPMDIRITFCGAINENLPAEIADQGAWLEKWGWIPNTYGSTGLNEVQGYPDQGGAIPTVHGPNGLIAKTVPGLPGAGGNGIVYEFDERALTPYAPAFSSLAGQPLRRNPYHPLQPLPFAPRLPVAPGLLYYGQNTVRP